MSEQRPNMIAPILIAIAGVTLTVSALVLLEPTAPGEQAASDAELSSARTALQVALSSARSTASQAGEQNADALSAAIERCSPLLEGEALADIRSCETELLTLTAEVVQGL